MSAAAVKKRTFGVIAEFGSAAELYRAAERVRDQGYRFWDAHSPFPIHGLNEAMGLKKSHLLEYIPTSFLFPLIVRGKPVDFFTVPAFFPIMFELTILFAGFTAFFGVFVMNRLPRLHHPLFDHAPFARVTDHAVFIVIESGDPKFAEAGTSEFLEEIGGRGVTVLYESD